MSKPRSFQVELYKVSFDQKKNTAGCPNGKRTITIEHKRTHNYQTFSKLESLGKWLDERDHAMNKHEAALILERAVRWFWKS